ncbi:MAG TPA: hypothetical protein VG733_15185 [Chthoniobacteraceae bacterium]|nr:hypothetical protein [Chthoniobacteraceae bacterium]
MRTRPTVLPACLLAAALACPGVARAEDDAAANDNAPRTDDLLVFANGDSLHGTLVGADLSGLRMQSAYSTSASVFRTGNLVKALFRTRAPRADAAADARQVLFRNGDVLPGAIVSLDEKTLVLDTWYAGRLNIPRGAVVSIGNPGFPYDGPTSLAGWVLTPAKDGWTYADGAFTTNTTSAIGHPMNFPMQSRIEFDAFPGDNPQLCIYLGLDRTGRIGKSYVIQVNYSVVFGHISFAVELSHFENGVTVQAADPVKLDPEIQIAARTHFDIRIDKAAKTIWLYLNGKIVKQYINLDDLPSLGGSLIFTPGISGELHRNGLGLQPIRITNIRAGVWDGNAAAGALQAKGGKDSVVLASGAELHGRLSGIADGKATLVSSGSNTVTPLAQVDGISFASVAAASANPGANAVRASLAGGNGIVTFEFESWEGNTAAVTSPDFGKAVFLPEAFQRLDFNLDKLEPKDPQPAAADPSQSPAPSPESELPPVFRLNNTGHSGMSL